MRWLLPFLSRLRYPWVLVIVAVLFLINLIIPDPLPLADELMFGLLTVLLASWKKRRGIDEPDAPDDVIDAAPEQE